MLELCHVEKAYGENKVLSDVNVKVNKDEIYGLIGKNGAGKITIFKIILGLTNYTGDLSIKGSTNENELLESREKIGFFIGQNFFSYLNAKDNIEYYRQVKGIKDKGEVDRVLKIVDLDGVKVPFKSFSLGMKQRLGIANAILGNPEILILDEPINGLDPQGISDVRNLIKTLNTEYKMTIVVSSHILGELEHTATRFGIVHGGKIIKEIGLDDLTVEKDTLELKVDDLEKAKKVLQENNVRILAEKSGSKTLEDYYFELVGGHDA